MTKFYLPLDEWSPRFDTTFFSVKIHRRIKFDHEPVNSGSHSSNIKVKGNTHYPATYYEIQVLCGETTQVCPRRFSEFDWCFKNLQSSPCEMPPDAISSGIFSEPMRLPPKTCPFQVIDDDFLDNRLEELNEFLTDVLRRPGYAQHEAIVALLNLDCLPKEDDSSSGEK